MQIPILIFAQSARFLAQSAAQAGYPVWTADCFGDQDTHSATDRWQKIPALKKLNQHNFLSTLQALSKGQKCHLICGGGVEHYYLFLNKLPNHIQLLGNSLNTIRTITTPSLFFELLSQLDIAYPTTQFTSPNNTENWLTKSALGLGGEHIQYLMPNFQPTDHYFQSHILGLSGSCLFLTDGKQIVLLSINKQKLSPSQNAPFRLGSIETPWVISDQHQQYLKKIIEEITIQTHLLGLNSIDFIISDTNELLILEINPRPSASAELITSDTPLFQHHINACQGVLPPVTICNQTSIKASLRYIFAMTDIMVPTNMSWPTACHDIPSARTIIKKDEPLCTVIVQANSFTKIHQEHDAIENEIYDNLLP